MLRKSRCSSEDGLSDNEHFISSRRLVILPPKDEGNRDTDKIQDMKMSFSQRI